MKNFSSLIAVAVSGLLLSACGGGSSDEGARALDTNTPPTIAQMEGPNFTADVKRMRELRHEKWQEGDAVAPTVIPAEKLGVDPMAGRSKALAVGDPGDQKVMGETSPVAPPLAAIPANAATQGAFGQVYNWPLIPIHMAMMPDGRLMSFGTTALGRQTGFTIYDIYDPAQGLFNGHLTLPNNTGVDQFCSSQVFLASSNEMLTIGGDVYSEAATSSINTGTNATALFKGTTNTLTKGNNMNLPRWYASGITLRNGETFIMGGLGGEAYPEIRGTNGTFRPLTGADTSRLDYWYPRIFEKEDGRVFGYDSYGNYYMVNVAGTGSLQIINQWDYTRFGETGSAVQYRPGKILQLAGYSTSASIIDFSGATPTFTATTNSPLRRQTGTASLLPNGNVIYTGGSTNYNELATAHRSVDIWNPTTGQWTRGASGTQSRLYHSINMLMPDGTVLIGGGGAWGPESNTNVEFYYPPYLFNGAQMAVRPTVTAAPTNVAIGGTFQLTVNDPTSPIARVTMIKSGSVTHDMNLEQNFNELTFTRAGNVLTVTAPTVALNAPPGYYMVFAINAAGVPAQARMVRIDVAGTVVTPPPPPPPPVATVPGAPTTLAGGYTYGTGVRLNWAASAGTVTSVSVERRTGAGGAWAVLAVLGNVTTYTDPIATQATYNYRVRSANSAGYSVYSNIAAVSVTAPPTQTLPAPSGLSGYTCGAGCWSTDTGVRFNWTPVTGATTHVVQRAEGAGTFATVATLGAGVGIYIDKNVTSGVTYFYRVQALNATATSAISTLTYGVTSNITLGGGQPQITPPNSNPAVTGGAVVGNIALSGSTSTPSTGAALVGYEWALTSVGTTGATFVGAINGVNATVNTTAAGTFIASLKITDSAGQVHTDTVSVTVTAPAQGGTFSIVSQEQTRYLVMNWWRANPATEGDFRDPGKVGGMCTGPGTTGGDCYLGARKTFRPQAFNIATAPATVAGLIMMDVPQFDNGVYSYAHYKLPVELIKNGCSFSVRHVRTKTNLEFGLNPPGLEILPHQFNMTQALCDSYPAGAMTQAWLNALNTQLTTYLGAPVAYNPIAYPYNDPRTHTDPTN